MSDIRSTTLDLASSQRSMMWSAILKIGLDFGSQRLLREVSSPLQIAFFAIYLLVCLVTAYFVFRVARIIYGAGPAVICGILVFVPCVGALAILALNGTSMDRLRKAGVKSGFFGPDKPEMDKLLTVQDAPN